MRALLSSADLERAAAAAIVDKFGLQRIESRAPGALGLDPRVGLA